MRISARNQLKGTIVNLVKGQVLTKVTIDIGGQTVTAAILNESAEDLGLKVGNPATAVIKATEVLVAVE